MEIQSVQVVRLRRGASGNPRPVHRQPTHLVSVLTRGKLYLRKVTQKEAWRMVEQGRCRIDKKIDGRERRARLKTIIDLRAGWDQHLPAGALKTTYHEDLGDTRSLITSKRVQRVDKEHGHDFVKYDPDLTFSELRAGAFVSAVTRVRLAAARAERAFIKK